MSLSLFLFFSLETVETETQRGLWAVKTALPRQLLAGFLRRDGQLNFCSWSVPFTSIFISNQTTSIHKGYCSLLCLNLSWINRILWQEATQKTDNLYLYSMFCFALLFSVTMIRIDSLIWGVYQSKPLYFFLHWRGPGDLSRVSPGFS